MGCISFSPMRIKWAHPHHDGADFIWTRIRYFLHMSLLDSTKHSRISYISANKWKKSFHHTGSCAGSSPVGSPDKQNTAYLWVSSMSAWTHEHPNHHHLHSLYNHHASTHYTGLVENAARPAASAAVGVEGLDIFTLGDTSFPFPCSGATFDSDDVAGLSASAPFSPSAGGGE